MSAESYTAPIVQHCLSCRVCVARVDPSWDKVRFRLPSTVSLRPFPAVHGQGVGFIHDFWSLHATFSKLDECPKCKKGLSDGPVPSIDPLG